ncbi:MAG: hypothetical protein GKR94_33870 [Gammaproteobacteria bacterium]|nr:hypothetical protein [Gammaproteobacteria bacterium]
MNARVISSVLGVVMMVSNAAPLAVTVQKGALTVEFPNEPQTAEAVDETNLGEVARFAAVSVTPTCDYALFVHSYSPQIVALLGKTSLLGKTVQQSVATHRARVERMRRAERKGVEVIEMDFAVQADKSTGRARFLQVEHQVYEVSTLCEEGSQPDADFFGT